jgi:5-methylthioadenosine/S-adenosylhomocysteine deaminase
MSTQWLIEHATVVTMNAGREILQNTSIATSGDQIAAIGELEALRAAYPAAARLDASGKVALPGLINCHTHIPMSLQKGITLAIPDGLYRVMWPVEKNLTAEDVYIGALAGGAEALLGGSTTVLDHYFFAEQTAKAVIELGLRGVIGHTIMSRLGPITGEAEMEEAIDFVKRWKGRDPLVIPWLAPHASDTVATDWLLRLRRVASEEGVGLHLHVAQSPLERSYIKEQHGKSNVQYLADLGFLDKDVVAAHCIFITEEDMDLLAQSGAHPVYCPMGHSLGGHPAQAWKMIQKGADVIIGTDCVTSNNEMDLAGELRIAGAAQKQMTGDSQAMPASKILEMVTVNAAKAIGMGDRLGTLAPGYLADLILLDFDRMPVAPAYSLLDNIVYCCGGRDVNTVFVNGRMVVREGKLLTMDEKELVGRIEERGHSLMSRAVKGDAELEELFKSSRWYSI